MKKVFLFLITFVVIALVSSCKSTLSIQENKASSSYSDVKKYKIVATAKKYLGTPYKWAGTTKGGMDCSGLVYTTFLENDYHLPRGSKDQAEVGKTISLKNTVPGDLVFFKTGNSNKINHVGIVIENNLNEVKFIHTSSSRGVIISSMSEIYWDRNYQHAKRVLNSKTVKTSTNTKTYKVKTGDTLYSISRKFNTTVDNLKKANDLNSNTIDVGMLLKIN